MPDVCPAASSLLDLEAVLCRQSPSFCEIGLLGSSPGLLHKRGNEPGGFLDYGSVHILIIPLVAPPQIPVLCRPALAALVELGKKPQGVFAVLEVRGVESRPVVVGDEAAMGYEVPVEPVGEVLPAKPALEEPDPGFDHECLLSRAHELRIAKRVLPHRIRNAAT